jgi:SAM-dependent methyltransferase
LPEAQKPEEIFSDYAYFSSYSDSWLKHAETYAAAMTERLGLSSDSLVVEIASNDGYLLRFFAERGIPVQGVDPAANVAAKAIEDGIPTRVDFFGNGVARVMVAEGQRADLLLGNNVLAHVPDLNDFVAGLATLLSATGTLTMEFPHLLRLMEGGQFDTIYHEHYSYLSLATVRQVFEHHGLQIFDVEEWPTHGGSLRIFARHVGDPDRPVSDAVEALTEREKQAGLRDPATYQAFGERVHRIKRDLLRFLIEAREEGKTVVGYGAPAKGVTLLNYCGIREDLLAYTVDRSPHKQGHFLPGVRIPIHGPERIMETRPDYVLILPWNLRDEIAQQMFEIRDWGGRFVVAIPEVEVF